MRPTTEAPALFVRRLEAAQLLGLSLSSIVRRIADGTLPHVRIGGSILIPRQAITALTNPNPTNNKEAQ